MMSRIYFLFFRWWLRTIILPQLSALNALPYAVFLSFELENIWRIGGMRAVREATDGWVAKQQDAWKHAIAEATKKPLEETPIGDSGFAFVKYAPEEPVVVELPNGGKATLRDIKFSTVATAIVGQFSKLVDGEVEVTVNGKPVGLGYWLRPGDVVDLKKIGPEEGPKNE